MERAKVVEAMRRKMMHLRKDESLITGVTFNTLAGDIKVGTKERALTLLDHFIKDLQDEEIYLTK